MNYEDEAFDELEKKLQKQVAHGVTDGSLWRKRQVQGEEHMKDEALKQKLGMEQRNRGSVGFQEALAQPEQEPVNEIQIVQGIPFFTPPKQCSWVGLTQEEVEDSYNSDYKAQTRAIEAKLKQKNGYAEE